MPKDIPIGNGSLLILFNKKWLLRDLYFLSAGSEDHGQGQVFRFVAWVNNVLNVPLLDG